MSINNDMTPSETFFVNVTARLYPVTFSGRQDKDGFSLLAVIPREQSYGGPKKIVEAILDEAKKAGVQVAGVYIPKRYQGQGHPYTTDEMKRVYPEPV